MSFQDAVRTCLQQKYADFNGRARRSEYWFFILFSVIAGIVANILNSILQLPSSSTGTTLLGSLLNLALLLPNLGVAVRRLHDTGRSGWWLLIALTGVGVIVLIVFFVFDSQGDNKYGPSPKAAGGGFGMPPVGYGQPPA